MRNNFIIIAINNVRLFIEYKSVILKIFSFIDFFDFEILINILSIIYEFVIIFNYSFRLLLLIYLLIFFFIIKNVITFIHIFNLKYI